MVEGIAAVGVGIIFEFFGGVVLRGDAAGILGVVEGERIAEVADGGTNERLFGDERYFVEAELVPLLSGQGLTGLLCSMEAISMGVRW